MNNKSKYPSIGKCYIIDSLNGSKTAFKVHDMYLDGIHTMVFINEAFGHNMTTNKVVVHSPIHTDLYSSWLNTHTCTEWDEDEFDDAYANARQSEYFEKLMEDED